MNVALAGPDKWARYGESDVGNGNEYGHADNDRHHVRQTVQVAEHARVHKTRPGGKMAIVVDMMCAVVTRGHGSTALGLRVVVEGGGEHHRQIHQYEQPRKPYSSIVMMAHYPNAVLVGTKVALFFVTVVRTPEISSFFSNCNSYEISDWPTGCLRRAHGPLPPC